MILISNDFWHKIKINNFDPNNVLLAISTNTRCYYDCFCAAGTHITVLEVIDRVVLNMFAHILLASVLEPVAGLRFSPGVRVLQLLSALPGKKIELGLVQKHSTGLSRCTLSLVCSPVFDL